MTDKYSLQFAKNALALIKADDTLKVGDVEKRLGKRQGYLSQIINHRIFHIPIDACFDISEILGVSVEDLCMKDFTNIANELKANALELEVAKLKAEIAKLRGESE